MALRTCIDCGELCRGTRCARHEAAKGRERARRYGTSTKRGYDRQHRNRAHDAIDAHVALYGWICPGWQRAPHESRDLTADHRIPISRGGLDGPLDVLCRSCNGSKGSK